MCNLAVCFALGYKICRDYFITHLKLNENEMGRSLQRHSHSFLYAWFWVTYQIYLTGMTALEKHIKKREPNRINRSFTAPK